MLEWAFGGGPCHLIGWPPLSVAQNSHFLTPSRASGAPAAQRADLGRAHQPPDGWSRYSVAVRATSLAGPPTQMVEAGHSLRYPPRRGRLKRGALVSGAPTHPQMAGTGIQRPCVPRLRVVAAVRRSRRPFGSATSRVWSAFAAAEALETPRRKPVPI